MSKRELSLDLVDSLCEVWEGFVLMDHHGVSKDNCQSLQDIKERLRLHYYRQTGQGRSPSAHHDEFERKLTESYITGA